MARQIVYYQKKAFRPFIIKVNSGADSQFEVLSGASSNFPYGFETSDGQSFSNRAGSTVVAFPSANTDYFINFKADFIYPNFGYTSATNRAKIKNIVQYGTIKFLNLSLAFSNLPNCDFNALDIPETRLCTIFKSTFQNSPFNENVSNWDVSSGIIFGEMFRGTPFNNGGQTLDWSSPTTGSVSAKQIHAFAYACQLQGYKLQAGNVVLVTNNNLTNSANISELINMSVSFFIAQAPITGTELNDLANSVKDMTGLTSPTVTVSTDQYNSTGFTPSLFTAKNWTISQI